MIHGGTLGQKWRLAATERREVMRNHSDGVYKRQDRDGYWISWTDAQGRRRYRKTHAKTLQQARTLRASELARVEQAKALGFAPAGEETFAVVAKRFMEYQQARLTPKAYEREKGIVENRLCKFFNCDIAGIRRVDVQRYVTTRSPEVSAHSVLKELNVLKHFLRLAQEWEIIPINPAHGVKPPRVPAGRVRYLQPTELWLVLDASPDWLRSVVAFAVCTGMRRSEILGLRALDVDAANSRVMLPQTKNGEGRIVYLNQMSLAVLASLPTPSKPSDLIFAGISPEQVSMAFSRVCRKVGIDDFRFHDLRHTAASWLRMQGADIHTVAQLLGHKDLRMAARYQHLSPAFLGEAVNRLDSIFANPRYPRVTAQEVQTPLPSVSAG
jgi:integrase